MLFLSLRCHPQMRQKLNAASPLAWDQDLGYPVHTHEAGPHSGIITCSTTLLECFQFVYGIIYFWQELTIRCSVEKLQFLWHVTWHGSQC
jgi:hypothetical protein